MRETSYHAVIAEMTVRSLWETQNVMDCIPDELWQRLYGGAPLWQHLYHALHSLDQWFINPKATDFVEPPIHTPHLQDLAIYPSAFATRNGNAANEANTTLSQDSSHPLDNRAIAGNRYQIGRASCRERV